MININDITTNKDWELVVSRPFSLFLVSLWDRCYDKYIPLVTDGKCNISDVVFIQHQNGVVDNFRKTEDLNRVKEQVRQMYEANKNNILELLDTAEQINKQAERYINHELVFNDFHEMVDLTCKLIAFAALLPYFLLKLHEAKLEIDSNILKRSEDFRSMSFYPKIMTEFLVPSVKKVMEESGVNDSENAVNFILLNELEELNFAHIDERIQSRQSGKTFVYSIIDGNKELVWQENGLVHDESLSLSGRTAFLGLVKGVARVVLTIDGSDALLFNPGDILISINSSPNLMHLIKKSAAIVTDEGGITCHAAIVSRELKIPCIIGTKNATRTIHSGDLIEVDADKGVVTILERAKQK